MQRHFFPAPIIHSSSSITSQLTSFETQSCTTLVNTHPLSVVAFCGRQHRWEACTASRSSEANAANLQNRTPRGHILPPVAAGIPCQLHIFCNAPFAARSVSGVELENRTSGCTFWPEAQNLPVVRNNPLCYSVKQRGGTSSRIGGPSRAQDGSIRASPRISVRGIFGKHGYFIL